MITEADLLQAIAECQGERNPNANTCVKLAAFMTIYDHLYGNRESYAEQPSAVSTMSGVLFSGKPIEAVLPLLDELVDAVSVLNPRLYAAFQRKIEQL